MIGRRMTVQCLEIKVWISKFTLCAAFFAATAAFAAETASPEEDWSRIYATWNPVISGDGAQVHFIWAGTNWTASATGGIARVSPICHPPFDPGDFSREMHEARAFDCAVSPDGKRVAFRYRGGNRWRARYGTRSANSGEIWLYDSVGKSFKRISRGDSDSRTPAWLGGNAIAYVKANDHGSRDVVRIDLASGREELLVPGGEWQISSLSASKDGKTLLYRRGYDLWRADVADDGRAKERMLVFHPEESWKRPSRVRERFYDPTAWGKRKNGKVWNNDGNGSVCSPTNGESVIFTTGGDLWAVKPGNGTNVPVRLRGETKTHERSAVVTRDGLSIYYVRDYGDKSEIWRMRRKDASKPWHAPGELVEDRFVSGSDFFMDMKLSPGEKILSWTEYEGRLMIMHLEGKGKIVEITPPGTFRCCEYRWSPDGRYIAVAAADKNRNFDVWVIDAIASLRGKKNAVNVSDHFSWDGDPTWSGDSKTLAFRGEWGECGTSHFKVDMKRKLSTGCATLVKSADVGKLKESFAKGRDVRLPYFKAHQKTSIDDYFELAFRTAVGRLRSRFLGGRNALVDVGRMMRYLPAARHAATWMEFHKVLNMAMGEIDASHIAFSATDASKKEWPVQNPEKRGRKAKGKIAATAKNREAVEKATGGKWSYVRLKSTNAEGFDNFRNDLYRCGRSREGLVIDMRDNSGGNRADAMVACLMMPSHGWIDWSRGRGGYIVDHMQRVQFCGDLVVIIDEDAASNGEMFARMMKTFRRAVLVGRPTAGEVLATENVSLLDLGEFRIPQGIWFDENGLSMENNGVEPDVRIDDTPEEMSRNVDSQLLKAIEEAKKICEKKQQVKNNKKKGEE